MCKELFKTIMYKQIELFSLSCPPFLLSKLLNIYSLWRITVKNVLNAADDRQCLKNIEQPLIQVFNELVQKLFFSQPVIIL